MKQQRSFPFSHIKTFAWVHVWSLFFVIIVNANDSSAALHPSVLSVLRFEHERSRWLEFLTQVQHQGGPNFRDFSWFVREMRFLSTQSSAQENAIDPILDYFNSIRDQMPFEFRWVLAAAEISRNRIADETVGDAKSALLNTKVLHRYDVASGARISLEVDYSLPGGRGSKKRASSELFFPSVEDFLFVYQHLHRAPEFRVTDFLGKEIETIRGDWLLHLEVLAKEISGQSLLKALLQLSHPNLRRFSSSETKQIFMYRVVNLIQNYGYRFGEMGLNAYGEARHELTGSSKMVYDSIRDLIRSWLTEDLSFLSQNYDMYLRRGLISMSDFMAINLSGEKKKQVQQILNLEEKVPFASYILNSLLWLKNFSQENDNTSLIASDRMVRLLFEATHGLGESVKLPGGILSAQHIYPLDYLHYVDTFYQVVVPPVRLDPSVLQRIKNVRHLRFESMKDEEWLALETRRLHLIQNQSSPAEFNQYIRKIFVDGAANYSTKDRIFVANFFQAHGDPAAAKEMADALKAKTRPRFSFSRESSNRAAWNKKQGELIHLIRAINPQDSEFGAFLIEVFLTTPYDAALSGQQALTLIEEIGIKSNAVRDNLLRSLQHVNSGDSAGALRALLRLFPDQSVKVAEIIYTHRVEPKRKLIPMLEQLLEQAQINPSLVLLVRKGIRNNPNHSASNHLYQGLRLDDWLEQRVLSYLKSHEVRSCEYLWRQNEY